MRGCSEARLCLDRARVEALQLIGQGLRESHPQRLNLSSKTVDVHREHIKEKLQLENATSLICFAVRWVESQKSSTPTSNG
jgi:DNA-binding NarL/FixJ family response regulator